MGLTRLSTGLVIGLLGVGTVSQLVAATVYPIGFLAVAIGRAQLFTENTLFVGDLTEPRMCNSNLGRLPSLWMSPPNSIIVRADSISSL